MQRDKAACVEINKLQDVASDEFGAQADTLLEVSDSP